MCTQLIVCVYYFTEECYKFRAICPSHECEICFSRTTMEQETCTDEEPNVSSPQFSANIKQDIVKDSLHIHLDLLQCELMKARLDIQGYLATITSLQHKLIAVERTLLNLRARERSTSNKKQEENAIHPPGPHKETECFHEPGKTVLATHDVISADIDTRITSSSGKPTKSSGRQAIFGTMSCPDAPISFYRGTSTSFLSRSYFSPSGSHQIFVYDDEAGIWSELPGCPNTYFSLVTINGLITAVGGWVGGERKRPANAILSLLSKSHLQHQDEPSAMKNDKIELEGDSPDSITTLNWNEHYPPMPTRRGYPAAIAHDLWVVVVGGDTTWLRESFLSTVEVLNTTTFQWFTASSLPRPLRGATAAVCVNVDSNDATLYLLGGWDKSGNAVFACSLQSLLSTVILCVPDGTLPNPSATTAPCSCIWRMVASAPCSGSSCVSLGNKLFTFGGKRCSGGGSEYVHAYSEVTNEWQCVGRMSVGRSYPLVTGLADGCRAVVVGGLTKGPHITNHCEVALLLPQTETEIDDGKLCITPERTEVEQLESAMQQLNNC